MSGKNHGEDARGVLQNEKPFTYRITKNEKAFVYWHGKEVTIVSGAKFKDFLRASQTLDELGMQHYLARLTGHFKHGNER